MFRWTEKRKQALALLVDGEKTNTDIAIECGVTRQSIQNWLKKPEFIERRKEMTEVIISDATNLFRGKTREAAQTIVDLSRTSDRDSIVQFHSAMAILGFVGITPVTKMALTNPAGDEEFGASKQRLNDKLSAILASRVAIPVPGQPDAEGIG